MLLSVAIRQRIINLSKEHNLNFSELCRKSDVSYSALMGFMYDTNKTLTINTLYQLCLGFEIDLVDFFDSDLFKNVLDEHEKVGK